MANTSRWLAREVRDVAYLTALATHVATLALRPSSWTRAVRNVLWRQVFFTGAQAMTLAGVVAMLVGVAVVLQARVWLSQVGQTELLGPLLVTVIVRELAPLLVGLIVIMRSGSAMATELGNMTVRREVHLLAALGVDPLRYLVLPRIAGMVVSVVCLDILFTITAFATGYLASLLTALQDAGPLDFIVGVLTPLRWTDVASPLAKSLLAPICVGAVCCHAGLACGSASTEVPKAATRALSGSMIALFLVCVLITALSYQL